MSKYRFFTDAEQAYDDYCRLPGPFEGWQNVGPRELAQRSTDWWGGLDADHLRDDWGIDLADSFVVGVDFNKGSVATDSVDIAEYLNYEPTETYRLFGEPVTVVRFVPLSRTVDAWLIVEPIGLSTAKTELLLGLVFSILGRQPPIVVSSLHVSGTEQYFGLVAREAIAVEDRGTYSVNGGAPEPVTYRAKEVGWPQMSPTELHRLITSSSGRPVGRMPSVVEPIETDLAVLTAAGHKSAKAARRNARGPWHKAARRRLAWIGTDRSTAFWDLPKWRRQIGGL